MKLETLIKSARRAMVLTLAAAGTLAFCRRRALLRHARETEDHQLRTLASLIRFYASIYYVNLDADTC